MALHNRDTRHIPAEQFTIPGKQLLITRVFDAPREVVFQAWSSAEQLQRWHAPNGCTFEVKKLDFHAGGSFHTLIKNPAFGDCWCKGVYREVDPPKKIVYTIGLCDANGNSVDSIAAGHDPEWPRETVVTLTFEEQGNKTKLTLHQTVSEELAKKTGAYPSWLQMLDHLAENLDLVIVREYDAPRKLVFQAWTDPKQLAQWWGPEGFTAPRCEFDARKGGKIYIEMRGPDGTIYPMSGTVDEIVEPERLVFTAAALENGKPVLEDRTTVTFVEKNGKTIQTLRARILSLSGVGAGYAAGMDEGWKGSLVRLESLLSKA